MAESLTVLMAVHNGGAYLRPAVQSILAQTYGNFRFLVIDDASTDDTAEILRAYRDPRMEVVRLSRNVGQTAALNLGFRRIRTDWVARMDADDYSTSERLAEQMAAVSESPAIACVGTGIWEFHADPQRWETVILRPASHSAIWQAELLGSGIIHGSILVRRDAVLSVGGYAESYRYASDRVLFLHLLRRYHAVNLQKPLVGLRRHPGQDSFSLRAADEYVEVYQNALKDRTFTSKEVRLLRRSLACAHLFRARCRQRNGQFHPAWIDRWEAARISPVGWYRHQMGPWARRLFSPALLQRFQEKRLGTRYENS